MIFEEHMEMDGECRNDWLFASGNLVQKHRMVSTTDRPDMTHTVAVDSVREVIRTKLL